jgi:uncharacterized membrane protein YcaP (DUF421 family)
MANSRTAGYDSGGVVNLLTAVMAGRIGDIDNGVMMCSAVFLIAATVVRWALSGHLRRITDPSPQVLIRNGVIDAATLRRRFMTRSEIRARLAAQGHAQLERIELATIDIDGVITVLHPHRSSDHTARTTIAAPSPRPAPKPRQHRRTS